MRFILDTNILIPLEQSAHSLEASLANFVRLAHENNHKLIYHPASEDDIGRDTNPVRKTQTLERLRQYTKLDDRPDCPWNNETTSANDRADNEILYSLYCDAAHALVTQDQKLHKKAKEFGLGSRVYYIQTADDLLCRLHSTSSIQLPNIEEVGLFSLSPLLTSNFFDSLRAGYPDFDDWFKTKAREGTRAWVVWEEDGVLGAICIFDKQINQTVTEEGVTLPGVSLKLCTFKVGDNIRGRKIGELFLKAAFRYASVNRYENIFIHGEYELHQHLFGLLEDFGFEPVGSHPGSEGRDIVYVKKHPIHPPSDDISSFEFSKKYFPHFRMGEEVNKYMVPIKPNFHRILFPDYQSSFGTQLGLFEEPVTTGNAIKLAYLCHANIKSIKAGDIVLFYRSGDEQAITSIGIVEEYESLSDADQIAQMVSRRTVYNMQEISNMASKETRVMLFRLVKHIDEAIAFNWLIQNGCVNGPIQSIQSIKHQNFMRIKEYAGL